MERKIIDWQEEVDKRELQHVPETETGMLNGLF